MKIVFSVLLILQFAYAQSVVISDGFEVNYDGWFASGDFANIKAHQGLGYNMSRGMKITDRQTPSDGAMSEKFFYLSGGKEYNYSVFVRHEQPVSETFNLALGSQVIASAVVPSGKWAELTAKYTAPQNVENLTLSITTNSTADFIFDDFKVTQKNSGYSVFSAPYDDVGLKDIYANYFRVGNILNNSTVNNTGIKNIVIKEYNSISAENEMKPDATMNRIGSTNTNIVARANNASAILNFCAQNNIPVRGHVLTWHGQTPDWFFIANVQDANYQNYRSGAVSAVPWAAKEVMNQRLESYIKNLFALYQEQYPGAYIYAYDVTNEAFDGAGNMRPAGFDHNGAGGQDASSAGNSPWQAIYGANNIDWIKNAFTYARKYAPAYTKLFYNDFNEWDPPKRDGITSKVLKPLFEAGLLDGMGMQSHVSANPNDGWSGQTRHLAAMEHYAGIASGFEVQLTELDPSTQNGQYASQQPGRYSAIFQKAININNGKAGKITAICIWTPNDANTWLGSQHTPALHDASNNRKPAYDSVASLVPQERWGNGNNPGFVSSSSNNVPSSSSSSVIGGTQICEYQPSFCGGMAYANVLSSSTAIPAAGTCLFIGNFDIIQPNLNSAISINGEDNVCGTEWSGCGYNTKPTAKDGGYYVYVKNGTVNAYENNGWQGIVAGAKPNCIDEPTPIFSKVPTAHFSSTAEVYDLKGNKVTGKLLPSGVYLEKRLGMPSKVFVVR